MREIQAPVYATTTILLILLLLIINQAQAQEGGGESTRSGTFYSYIHLGSGSGSCGGVLIFLLVGIAIALCSCCCKSWTDNTNREELWAWCNELPDDPSSAQGIMSDLSKRAAVARVLGWNSSIFLEAGKEYRFAGKWWMEGDVKTNECFIQFRPDKHAAITGEGRDELGTFTLEGVCGVGRNRVAFRKIYDDKNKTGQAGDYRWLIYQCMIGYSNGCGGSPLQLELACTWRYMGKENKWAHRGRAEFVQLTD